jgi:very-short-patch-repair endonuclease/predicted transcriptional regulator of viral defense system
VSDVRLIELAGRQHRCVARRQLHALGYGDGAIAHRVAGGRLIRLFEGVYAVAPDPADDRTRWMAATLTAPGSFLSHASAATAWGLRSFKPPFETVTRAGDGGPEQKERLLVCRSKALAGHVTTLEGIPITTAERTIIDLAPHLAGRALARAVRDAVRLKTTTPSDLFVSLARHRGRRGTRRMHAAVSRYAGLPLHRTRSDAEALALELLRDAGRPPAENNERIAGEEADLIWPAWRLIVELDGPQFHLDASEDLRKQHAWESEGWTVRRLPTDDVYLHPERLLALAVRPGGANVAE